MSDDGRQYCPSRIRLLAAMLWFILVVPTRADVRVDLTTAPAQSERGADRNGVADEEEGRELERFETADMSLQEALKIAGKCHFGARVVDISFDATGRTAVYRVKSIRRGHIWEDMIDTTTGRMMAVATESDFANLETTAEEISLRSDPSAWRLRTRCAWPNVTPQGARSAQACWPKTEN